MNLYDRFVLPRLIHLACGIRPIARQRRKVVPQAQGRVLGIGVGSGLNSSGEAAAGHNLMESYLSFMTLPHCWQVGFLR